MLLLVAKLRCLEFLGLTCDGHQAAMARCKVVEGCT
jgi:hypothetical protein